MLTGGTKILRLWIKRCEPGWIAAVKPRVNESLAGNLFLLASAYFDRGVMKRTYILMLHCIVLLLPTRPLSDRYHFQSDQLLTFIFRPVCTVIAAMYRCHPPTQVDLNSLMALPCKE